MSRISYRNYPTLKYMGEHTKPVNLFIYQEDFFTDKTVIDKATMIAKTVLFNKTKVTSISKNFIESVKKTFEKVSDIINKDISNGEVITINECFIIGGFTVHTIQRYSLLEFSVATSVFEKEGYLISSYESKYPGITDFLWETKSEPYFFEINNIRYNISIYFSKLILNCVYFKKYASVEIIESKARTKTSQFGCKYLNETDLDIEYLDSKWFTSLVNSNGFKVGGHFRLQPKKKDGEWTKELIWINDFEKKGYNRKAKILNN